MKQGRNIYLVTVARQPEKVVVPNLLNLSLRQALASIESSGFELGEISYTSHFARNAVVRQNHKGMAIEAGTQLFRGSTIDLVLGDGGEDFRVPFPMLIGLRPDEVKQSLHSQGLNLGNEYFIDNCTRDNGRAFRLQPFYRTSQAVKPEHLSQFGINRRTLSISIGMFATAFIYSKTNLPIPPKYLKKILNFRS